VEVVEGIVGPGIMRSEEIVAVRPRWVVEVMRVARADCSSSEAVGGWLEGGEDGGWIDERTGDA